MLEINFLWAQQPECLFQLLYGIVPKVLGTPARLDIEIWSVFGPECWRMGSVTRITYPRGTRTRTGGGFFSLFLFSFSYREITIFWWRQIKSTGEKGRNSRSHYSLSSFSSVCMYATRVQVEFLLCLACDWAWRKTLAVSSSSLQVWAHLNSLPNLYPCSNFSKSTLTSSVFPNWRTMSYWNPSALAPSRLRNGTKHGGWMPGRFPNAHLSAQLKNENAGKCGDPRGFV